MRSEKEIKEKLKELELESKCIKARGSCMDWVENRLSNSIKQQRLLQWVFEGEPRYSFEEIEKVLMWVLSEKNKIPLGHTPHLVNQYVLRATVSALELLKNNPEKVKEILGGN